MGSEEIEKRAGGGTGPTNQLQREGGERRGGGRQARREGQRGKKQATEWPKGEIHSRSRAGLCAAAAGCAAAIGPHPPRKGVKAIEESSHVFHSLTHLFEFVADEGERLVDGVRGARDGDDPLRTRAVADVDLGAALKEFSCQQICRLMCLAGRRIFLQEIKLNLPHL